MNIGQACSRPVVSTSAGSPDAIMRADTYLHQHRIRSTVVVFGSSRIKAPEDARTAAERALSRYYDEARQLGRILARGFAKPPAQTYLVHGEERSALALCERLQTKLGWRAAVPAPGETITL